MGRRAKATPARRPQGRGARQRERRKSGKGHEATNEDFEALCEQLKPLGLVVRKMEADGNCLFRAVADQIIGDCEEHMQFREECCNHMRDHAEEFEMFYAEEEEGDEEQSFATYIEEMRITGCWGCQLELMALCRRYEINAIVHQLGTPAYEMVAAPLDARCVQLSYHDGEHYNSIRFAGDLQPGKPARCLSLRQVRGNDCPEEENEAVQRVREYLPKDHSASAAAIRAALLRADGDEEAAVEELLSIVVGTNDAASVGSVPASASSPAAAVATVDATVPVATSAKQSSTVENQGQAVESESARPAAAGRSSGRLSHAEKKAEKQRQKRADKRNRQPEAPNACAPACLQGSPDNIGEAHVSEEALSRLTKQLIKV